MSDVKAIHIVHAAWCPHCHPTTVEPMMAEAEKLGIPFISYDIDDPEQEKRADDLVLKHGDWSEDYLVPQVFLEMSDGTIRHVLTGYSESVELTKHAVANLLKSPFFTNAVATPIDATVGGIARSLLNVGTRCSHCKQPAALEFIEDGTLMACHVCPDRYVSRIIKYGEELELSEFREFLRSATIGLERVIEDADIRIASRYAWDLGLDRANDGLVLREAYWTQNYRRTKSDEPNRQALFFCTNRDSFFVQPLGSGERLCESCRGRILA